MQPKHFLVATLMICLFACLGASAQDGPTEEHDDDGTSDCLADWDPFCPTSTPSGGTWENTTGGCYECVYIPEGPDGQPSEYVCSVTGDTNTGAPTRCSDYEWGCEMSGSCKLA